MIFRTCNKLPLPALSYLKQCLVKAASLNLGMEFPSPSWGSKFNGLDFQMFAAIYMVI